MATYTINYNLTHASNSGNVTIQITPNTGCDLPSTVTVTNGTLVSYDSTTGVVVLSSVTANTTLTCECVAPAPARALQDSASSYIMDSLNDYISSAAIPASALQDSQGSYVTDGWGAEIIAATSINNCLTFYVAQQQSTPFTLSMTGGKHWDGTLEYLDTTYGRWIPWDGGSISGVWDGTNTVLYLRGTGNTVITGYPPNSLEVGDRHFSITSAQKVYVSGNTEYLLDWQKVANGTHPTIGEYAFANLFYGCNQLDCDNLICGGETLDSYCYADAFYNCTGLTTPPSLPATTLANFCYVSMFRGCSYLTTAPALPATTLTSNCYSTMFRGCTRLVTAPALSATTLQLRCYSSMFYGCTSLTTAPELPATILATRCYESMFNGCTGLRTPPALPATQLLDSTAGRAEYCYYQMFYNSGITVAPSLPATTLAAHCYHYMFQNCRSLERLPALPATTLFAHCYYGMFYGCTKIKLSATSGGDYINEYRIPSSGTGTTAASAMAAMFGSTGGTFTGAPTINTTYYTSNTVVPATTT